MTMQDTERVQEIKDRLADRYTTGELAELVGIEVEDLIEQFWEQMLDKLEWLDVGIVEEET